MPLVLLLKAKQTNISLWVPHANLLNVWYVSRAGRPL